MRKNPIPKRGADDIAPAFADKDKVAEVLINLTSNAIKFTPENEPSKFKRSKDRTILVSLHDTGAGIPADAE